MTYSVVTLVALVTLVTLVTAKEFFGSEFSRENSYFYLIPKRQNSQKSPPSFDRPISNPYGKLKTS